MGDDGFEELIAAARRAADNAYAPASGFCVGAAVLDIDGRIHLGCNVENASYGLTICAERSAIAAMVAAGCRTAVAIAIVTPLPAPASPCGACRQVLMEFAPADDDAAGMQVILAGSGATTVCLRLADLLPRPFRFERE